MLRIRSTNRSGASSCQPRMRSWRRPLGPLALRPRDSYPLAQFGGSAPSTMNYRIQPRCRLGYLTLIGLFLLRAVWFTAHLAFAPHLGHEPLITDVSSLISHNSTHNHRGSGQHQRDFGFRHHHGTSDLGGLSGYEHPPERPQHPPHPAVDHLSDLLAPRLADEAPSKALPLLADALAELEAPWIGGSTAETPCVRGRAPPGPSKARAPPAA